MTNVTEIWLPVKGFEGYYEVSNLGRVKSLPKKLIMPNGGIKNYNESIMKQVDSRGYKRVKLSVNGKRKLITVHRLVACAFIPNLENKPTVNHINGMKNDNRVVNLEWATHEENETHAVENKLKCSGERHHFSKRVVDNKTGIIYQSATEAANSLGFNLYTLCDKLNGRSKNNTDLSYLS